MFNFTTNKKNVNSNSIKMLSHPSGLKNSKGWQFTIGEPVEKQALSYVAGGNTDS